jgi:hypothetical protein
MSPAGVAALSQSGHRIFVEHDAGAMAGFNDADYEQAGAVIAYACEEVIGRADLLLKVARPTAEELEWIRPGSILAGFLHLSLHGLCRWTRIPPSVRADTGCGWLATGAGLQPNRWAMAAQIVPPFQNKGGVSDGQACSAGGVDSGAGVVGTYAIRCSSEWAHDGHRSQPGAQRLGPPRGRDPALDAAQHRALACLRGCRGGRRVDTGPEDADGRNAGHGPIHAAALGHHGCEHR